MGAAFVALGEALINAIAIGLVGDDEYVAVRLGGGGDRKDRACQ